MKSKINIKNFRVFDDKGVIFEMNPITILTGSNSSGKSTALKAAFLLNGFLSQIKNAIENRNPIEHTLPIELDEYKLDFTTYPNNLLGRFDKVVHDGSESRSVTFGYSVYSLMLSKDVNIQLVFSADENDELNNAYPDSITMSTDAGIFYDSHKDEIPYCNLNIIKEDYITFLLTEFAINEYLDAKFDNKFNQNMNNDETVKRAKDYLLGIKESRIDDIFRYIKNSKNRESFIQKVGALPSALRKLQGKKSIFEIPIINKLSEMTKKDVQAYIESELIKGADEATIFASRKVINGFLDSKYSNFYDYFSDIEERLFNSYVLGLENVGLHLLDSEELALSPGYISFFQDQSNIDEVDLYGDVFENVCEFIEKNEATKKAEKLKEIDKWFARKMAFNILYEVVMRWNEIYCPNGKELYKGIYESDPFGCYSHLSFNLLSMFAEALLREVACPDWCDNMSYVSSARASVSRLYTLDTNNDFSLLLQRYFEKKRLYLEYAKGPEQPLKRHHYEIDSFMNRWIEKFEIGKAISLNIDEEGLGVQIRLHKDNDDKGRILADEGYGITQLVSILLQIETAILAANSTDVNFYYGLESLDRYDEKSSHSHYEISTIAIEEPEIHLHPKYQSLLADMFLEAYEKYNIHFIIETHSEYLIRKAQVFVARNQYETEEAMNKENPFKVIYVPRDEAPYEMEFCADGRFKNEFGKGFFDEATNLAFEIL